MESTQVCERAHSHVNKGMQQKQSVLLCSLPFLHPPTQTHPPTRGCARGVAADDVLGGVLPSRSCVLPSADCDVCVAADTTGALVKVVSFFTSATLLG